jgi:hypothetical protein
MPPKAAELLTPAKAYAAARSVGLRRLSERVGRDKLFIRLDRGGWCKPETTRHALEWFASNWPADVPWPSEIARPGEARTRLTPVEDAADAEEKPMMDDDEEAEAERIVEEKADAVFQARPEQAERLRRRQAEAAGQAEMERIRQALHTDRTCGSDIVDRSARPAWSCGYPPCRPAGGGAELGRADRGAYGTNRALAACRTGV